MNSRAKFFYTFLVVLIIHISLVSSISVRAKKRRNILDDRRITIDKSTVPQEVEHLLTFCEDSMAGKDLKNAVREILIQFSKDGPCNTNICFAVDGSSNLKDWQFGMQIRVIALISSLLSAGGSDSFFAGVQYAEFTSAIEPPTTSITEFLDILKDVKQVGSDRRNLAAGLGYCGFTLFLNRKEEGVLLVLGSGAPDKGFSPTFVSQQIRAPKGADSPVYAVSTTGLSDDYFPVVGGKKPEKSIFSVNKCADIPKFILDFIPKIC